MLFRPIAEETPVGGFGRTGYVVLPDESSFIPGVPEASDIHWDTICEGWTPGLFDLPKGSAPRAPGGREKLAARG